MWHEYRCVKRWNTNVRSFTWNSYYCVHKSAIKHWGNVMWILDNGLYCRLIMAYELSCPYCMWWYDWCVWYVIHNLNTPITLIITLDILYCINTNELITASRKLAADSTSIGPIGHKQHTCWISYVKWYVCMYATNLTCQWRVSEKVQRVSEWVSEWVSKWVSE